MAYGKVHASLKVQQPERCAMTNTEATTYIDPPEWLRPTRPPVKQAYYRGQEASRIGPSLVMTALCPCPSTNQTSCLRWQAGWFRGSRHIVARHAVVFLDEPESGPGKMGLLPRRIPICQSLLIRRLALMSLLLPFPATYEAQQPHHQSSHA